MNHLHAASRKVEIIAVGIALAALLPASAGVRAAISPGAGQAAAARSATTQAAAPFQAAGLPCLDQPPWTCPDGPPWG